MRFARIEMLFLVWAIPLLLLVIVHGMKKRRRILHRYASSRGMGAMVPDNGERRRWIKAGLFLLAMVFSVVAATGPQYGYRWEDEERKGVDIIVALDCSRSMLADDIRPSRLDRAKREVIDLLNMLQGDRVGLVAFAGTAFLQCPLTVDYETFHIFLGALTPDFLPVGGTDLGGAITTALSGFGEKDDSEKAVILITDGESTVADVSAAAEAARDAGVKIFSIGVGGADGVPIPEQEGGFKKDRAGSIVMTRLDEDPLKKIAVMTGGAYVRSVAGDMDLKAIYFDQIREKMDVKTLQTRRRQVWNDRYQWFLSFAVLLLVVELLLPVRRQVLTTVMLAIVLLTHPASSRAFDLKSSLTKGFEAYESGDYDTALKHFIDAQLDDPDRAEIFYNIGNAHYRLGDFESALQNYRQALDSKDADVRQKALYNGGNASFRLDQLQDAVKGYTTALDIDPDDRDTRMNLEFAKKKLAQQEKQRGQDGDDGQPGEKGDQEGTQGSGDNAGEKKNPPSENGEENKAGDQSPEDKGAASYGKEMAQDQIPEDESGQGSKDESAAGTDENAGAGGSQEQSGGKPDDNHAQAQRILNRLKDMPGKAMIPAYGNQAVEKDW